MFWISPAPDNLVSDDPNRHIFSDGDLARQSWIAEESSGTIMPLFRHGDTFIDPNAAGRAQTATTTVQLVRYARVWRIPGFKKYSTQIGTYGNVENVSLVLM